jgi:hypothetical protein
MKRVALLFLIIDDFPHEHIWLKWAEANPQISFFFHAKNETGVRSHFVRAHLVRRNGTFPAPEWGTVNLTRAMFYLLTAAAAAAPDAFVFLSESCIPVIPVDDFLSQVDAAAGRSWMRIFTKSNDEYSEKYQFAPLAAVFGAATVAKVDQWILLSASDAQIIISYVRANSTIWRYFTDLRASDEMFFSTILAICAGGAENLRRKTVDRRVTFVNWLEQKQNPKTYTHITPELIDFCRTEFQSPFLRKIKLPCAVDAAAAGKSCAAWRAREDKKQLYKEWLTYVCGVNPIFAAMRVAAEKIA